MLLYVGMLSLIKPLKTICEEKEKKKQTNKNKQTKKHPKLCRLDQEPFTCPTAATVGQVNVPHARKGLSVVEAWSVGSTRPS